jgi:uncharacterized surface protein with fasciclin (FAS1) repeats
MSCQNTTNLHKEQTGLVTFIATVTALVTLPMLIGSLPTLAADHQAIGTIANTQAQAKEGNLVQVTATHADFKTLTKALSEAGLTKTLEGKGPFTLFAPTDKAFAALPKGELETLLKPGNRAKLSKILTYHVVPGKVLAKDIKPGAVKTVEGSPVTVRVTPTKEVTVDNAKVSKADILASNGVIHAIDKVIMPPGI